MKSKENVKKGKYVHEPASGDSDENVLYVNNNNVY